MKNEWGTTHYYAARCVAYTRWLARCVMLAFVYFAWQAFNGLVEWDADGAEFPWLLLLGSVVLLGIGTSAGVAAQFAHHELARLIRSERKLLRLDPDIDLRTE